MKDKFNKFFFYKVLDKNKIFFLHLLQVKILSKLIYLKKQ